MRAEAMIFQCWLRPLGVAGVAAEGQGNVYVADAGNNRIRKAKR